MREAPLGCTFPDSSGHTGLGKAPLPFKAKRGGALHQHVVGGPHFVVGAGAADFHAGGALLVEEVGCAPRVAELAEAVEGGSVGERDFGLFAVVAEEGAGDFGVGADGVFAEGAAVVAEGKLDVVEDAEGVVAVGGGDGC